MESFNNANQYDSVANEENNDIVAQIEQMMEKVYEDLRKATYEDEGFDDCFFSIENPCEMKLSS